MHTSVSTPGNVSAHAGAVRHPAVTQALVLALLAVRLGAGASLALIPDASGWRGAVAMAYQVLTYGLTACLVWSARERLAEYQIGMLALLLILLSPWYQLLIALLGLPALPLPTTGVLLSMSAALALALGLTRSQIRLTPGSLGRWLVIAAGVGVAGGLFSGFFLRLQAAPRFQSFTLVQWLLLPSIQLTTAAVQEEPLFRGFLWGWLRLRGWRDGRIWLAQAGLFWLGHIYYLGAAPYSLWIIVPVMGLVLGLIAWRARDIAPGMLAHGLINGVGQIVGGT